MPENKLAFDYPTPRTLNLKISGDWRIFAGLPQVSEVMSQCFLHPEVKQITFRVSEALQWDSAIVAFLFELIKKCKAKNISIILEGLPEGIRSLVALAERLHKNVKPSLRPSEPFLEKVGTKVIQIKLNLLSLLTFLGTITVAFGRLITGKAYLRRDDFILIIQRCGAESLPLISLISILVGMILAFVGAIQLKMFGAQIYIANIVGIAMVRVMGAVMAGVLISGRIGASFAAELGIMQTNEEIDALKTLGIEPVEFLVMPRVLALTMMMPLLTLYADLMGILGGLIISSGILNLNPIEYLNRTQSAIKLNNVWIGLIHSFVFGVIISVAGCLKGIGCQRSAASVGEAATAAVVNAVTGIVIATAIITFICQVLGV